MKRGPSGKQTGYHYLTDNSNLILLLHLPRSTYIQGFRKKCYIKQTCVVKIKNILGSVIYNGCRQFGAYNSNTISICMQIVTSSNAVLLLKLLQPSMKELHVIFEDAQGISKLFCILNKHHIFDNPIMYPNLAKLQHESIIYLWEFCISLHPI
jgi:hypothetical protein